MLHDLVRYPVISSLPCDIIIYDAYGHNSLHMGIRLWQSQQSEQSQSSQQSSSSTATALEHLSSSTKKRSCSFQHNNVADLECQLFHIRQKQRQQEDAPVITVLIGRVFSMDGDVAFVQENLDVVRRFGAT